MTKQENSRQAVANALESATNGKGAAHVSIDQEGLLENARRIASDETAPERERAYYNRILRVLSMPNLCEVP